MHLRHYSGGGEVLFHGAGREDLDVRCLEDGRPFIIEAKLPKNRSIDLLGLENDINAEFGDQIHVSDFAFSSKAEVIKIKGDSQFSKKKYCALVYLNEPISIEYFNEKIKQLQSSLFAATKLYDRSHVHFVRE